MKLVGLLVTSMATLASPAFADPILLADVDLDSMTAGWGGPSGPPDFPGKHDFGGPIDNPFLSFKPGTTFVSTGLGGKLVDTVTVTHKTLELLGVTTVVVRDAVKVDGQLEELTRDFYAQDRQGNVWYFGEDAKQFENGKLVGTEGSWRAGVHGARPGIIMEAHPHVGDTYQQESAPGVAEDTAKVKSLNASVKVPYGSFDHALKTLEFSPLEPRAKENKFYARGVGLEVLTHDLVTGERDVLVSKSVATAVRSH